MISDKAANHGRKEIALYRPIQPFSGYSDAPPIKPFTVPAVVKKVFR